MKSPLIVSRYFCILPWVQVQASQTGVLYACCRMNPGYPYGSLESKPFPEIWNGQSVRDLRVRFLSGQALQECNACYRLDAAGIQSYRRMANRYFSNDFDRAELTLPDGTIESCNPLLVDLRFSNTCNFRCRTCSAESSTSWRQDAEALGYHPPGAVRDFTKSRQKLWDFIATVLPDIEHLYFAGGEPLLQVDHYRLLEKLIETGRTNVKLHYNTNFSTLSFNGWRVPLLWDKFKHVNVGVSIDGVGSHGELLRKGMRWLETEATFKKLRIFLPHVRFFIFITISAMNAFHLIDAIDYLVQGKMLRQPKDIEVNILDVPSHLNLNIFTREERARLSGYYGAYLDKIHKSTTPALYHTIEQIFQTVMGSFSTTVYWEERRTFRNYTLKLDLLRHEKFLELFPEHSELLRDHDVHC